MNNGYFDPKSGTLLLALNVEDVSISFEDDTERRVVIECLNLDGGIELHHEDERLWRPV